MTRIILALLVLVSVSARAQFVPDYLIHPTSACASNQTVQYLTPGSQATCWQVPYSAVSGTPTIPAPGGSDKQVQYNNAGSFGGIFAVNSGYGSLNVGGSTASTADRLAIQGTTGAGLGPYRGIYVQETVASGVLDYVGIQVAPTVAAGGGPDTVYGFSATDASLGAGASVGALGGFIASPASGSSNVGFTANVGASSGNYAFKSIGDARSKFGAQGIVLTPLTGAPSTLTNGAIWYDDTGSDAFGVRVNGATTALQLGPLTGDVTTSGAAATITYPILGSVSAKTSAYTVATTDRGKVISATSGTWTLTLTAAATLGAGFTFGLDNVGTGVITIDPNSTETIRDAAGSHTTITVGQGRSVVVQGDGAGWQVIASEKLPLSVTTPTAANITNSDVLRADGTWGASSAVSGSTGITRLYANASSSTNTSTSETDLIVFPMAAGRLAANLDTVDYRASGTIANNANNKRIKSYLGSTVMFDSGASVIPTSVALDWTLVGEVIRTGAATEVWNATFSTSAANGSFQSRSYTGTAAETLANSLNIKVTGTGGASSDVAQKSLTVNYAPYTSAITLTGTLAVPYQSETYSSTLTTNFGTSPYTYSVASGSLPAGLSLDGSTSSTLTITGTPTSNETSQSVTIQVVDANGLTATNTQALTVKDLQWSTVVALLHFEGTNGSQATFNDVKGKSWAWSGNGQLSTSGPLIGTSSALYDGNGDFTQVNDSADWFFGSGNFAITFWAKTATTSGSQMVSSQISPTYNGHQFDITATTLRYTCFSADSGTSKSATITRDTSSHYYKISRVGSSMYFFQDGVLKNTTTTCTTADSSGVLRIGMDWDATSSPFNGRIDEFRINNGAGRHTAGYTPPTGPSPEL